MNLRLVLNQLGLLLIVLSICILASDVASWLMLMGTERTGVMEHHARIAMLVTAVAGTTIGALAWIMTRGAARGFGRREALLLVGLSWLVGAALSGLPFLLWANLSGEAPDDHPYRGVVNCYFEAMSGLTTTGATVLSDIESLPPSLLLWRSLTHWLGGLGIVVLFVAVLPTLGVGGKKLFRVESPGPSPEGVTPQIRETARMLWFIYLGLTVAEIIALKLIGRMTLFDSVSHTFATLATGGFSTLNASVGQYDSATIDTIITVFMLAAGVNFALYFALLRRRFSGVFRDPELRFYLFLLLTGSAIVVAALLVSGEPIVRTTGEEVDANVVNSVRFGVFSLVSCQTTTGFCTADFDRWPFIAKAVLLTVMFIGGSAGSTGGGIKVIRIWIAIKVMISELERVFRPQVVRPVKIGAASVDNDLRLATLAYTLGIIVLFAVGSVVIMMLEQGSEGRPDLKYTTAATASIATLCNIGPGLDLVGPLQNYGWFSDASKVVMSLLMALGRLEVFAIILLFRPRFWRGD